MWRTVEQTLITICPKRNGNEKNHQFIHDKFRGSTDRVTRDEMSNLNRSFPIFEGNSEPIDLRTLVHFRKLETIIFSFGISSIVTRSVKTFELF